MHARLGSKMLTSAHKTKEMVIALTLQQCHTEGYEFGKEIIVHIVNVY